MCSTSWAGNRLKPVRRGMEPAAVVDVTVPRLTAALPQTARPSLVAPGGRTGRDTRHRPVQNDPPPDTVYAVALGHRTIFGCPHKPSMINAVAVFTLTPRPTPRPCDVGVLVKVDDGFSGYPPAKERLDRVADAFP